MSSVWDDAAQAETGRRSGDRAVPSCVAVREQLDRILASAGFVASDRLKSFLRFVVEEALELRADRLKAYTIALAVFGREPDFDPQTDPVVRMEAGKLRRRLERYYLDAGRDDPVRIEVPKGTYAPTFVLQRAAGPADAPENRAGPRRRFWSGSPWRATAAATAGLILLAVLWLSANAPPPQPPTARERGPAIIVLPFENLSGTPADDLFASGLTEELIANLMRFGELRLYSAYSSFLEQPGADPVELSRRLEVGYVVEGSVRREPDRVRLIVHLIEAQTSRHLWSQTYDRTLTPENVFGVQEQLAADLASQLAQPYGIINEVSAETFRQQRPDTLFAYECVLRAFEYRRTQGRAKHAAARACLEEAVRRDPGYADAWAFLAYNYLDEYRFGHPPRSYDPAALVQAASTARHAVDLDRDGVLPLLALSTVHFYRREFAEADEINRRLLSLNPTNPEVLGQIGWRTACAGDWDEGMALVRRAIDRSIAPPWGFHLFIAIDRYRRGDYQGALAEAAQIAEQGTAQVPILLAAIHGQLGNRDAGRQALDRAGEMSPSFLEDPWRAMRRHNTPEDLIEHVIEGMIKAGWQRPEST